MTSRRLPLSLPRVGDDELRLVREAIESNWVAPVGPQIDAFEREFVEYLGGGHALALSSGTAGLHLALLLAGVRAGDRVLCSTMTFTATASAIRYVGAEPAFVDSDFETWNLEPGLCAEAIRALSGEKTRLGAVLPVHLYGQMVDLQPILDASEALGVPVVEDAAEAVGATYHGRSAGTLGKMGVFSFNGNKILTTGGGGMLVSEDAELIARARFLSTHAKEPTPDGSYLHEAVGYNYRLSNVLAAIGLAQLRNVEQTIARRRWLFAQYVERLSDLPGLTWMPEASYGRSTRWLTCLCVDAGEFGADRETLRRALAADEIEARPLWRPMHLQPIFSGCRVFGGGCSEKLFETGLCLPSGAAIGEADVDRIASVFRQVHTRARRPRAG